MPGIPRLKWIEGYACAQNIDIHEKFHQVEEIINQYKICHVQKPNEVQCTFNKDETSHIDE